MKRRTLLQCAAGLTGVTLLEFLENRAAVSQGRGKVFVLLEMRGGNDGLNTVIPHGDALYRAARPKLALKEGIPLGRGLLLHPAMAPLQEAWQARRLAIALGVGWPNPNRSHFKAVDQWATGRSSGEGPGWLAQAFETAGSRGPLVSLNPLTSSAIEGTSLLSLQLSPASFGRQAFVVPDPSLAGENDTLRKILVLEASGQREVARLKRALAPLPAGLKIPAGDLGAQVALALRLIASDLAPPVLQLGSTGSFDTHQDQLGRHARQIGVVAEALAAFDRGLQRLPNRPQVTLLTTSEFGRRLKENASGGTDHGTASVSLLLGDQVPHPFVGTYPSLAKLDARGDLIASLAPPDLYARALAL
jgi:uncharacterized protein (DUF1501 family)